MTDSLVVDASVVVSALVDDGPTGRWAEGVLGAGPLAAPQLLHVEVVSVLRRAESTGQLSREVAALVHQDLLDLRVELVPYAPLAARIWELRGNVTAYDAWYVAVAEALDAPLATLDTKLVSASGPRCAFVVPS